MRRTTFAVALAAALFSAESHASRWNWSNNIEFTAKTALEKPSTADELATLIRDTRRSVKVVGTAHSFNDIADTDGIQISLANFQNISIDPSRMMVKFGGGVTYISLIKALAAEKMALQNLPSLPHINVVGSVVTGTHGSGMQNQAMGALVSEFAFVDASGAQRRLTREHHEGEFYRYLHSFGALGVIYEMTMDIEPEYGVAKCVYQDVPWDFLKDKEAYNELNQRHEYISYFTDWKEEKMTSIWIGSRYNPQNISYEDLLAQSYLDTCPPTYLEGTLTQKIHPVPGRSSDPCVESGYGMWNDKIYHFKPDKPPSSDGDEIQTEFFVKYADMPAAVAELYSNAALFRDFVQITEIRGVERDSIPLSPAKEQDVMGIHFTWKHDFKNVYFAAKTV